MKGHSGLFSYLHNPGCAAGVTTPLSILAHAGQECSQEFHAIHRVYPIAYKQLKAFYIGDLLETGEWQSKDTPPGPEPGRLHSGR